MNDVMFVIMINPTSGTQKYSYNDLALTKLVTVPTFSTVAHFRKKLLLFVNSTEK